jgi:ABC-type sugar transport system substrate-binding protein
MKGHKEVKLSLKKVITTAAAVAGVVALSLSSVAPSEAAGSGFGHRAKNRTAYFFTYYDPAGDAFWAQILKGGQDAAKLSNLKMTHQTANGSSSQMVNLVQTAISRKPAAIFMPFNEGQAWVNVACQAHKAGILVIAYNVPAPDSAGDCVSGFVGQDFYSVGVTVAKALLASGQVKKGDKVEITAEEPDQPYALQRGGGVYDTLKAAGIDVLPQKEWLRTGGDDAGALDALTSYLVANKDIKVMVPVGGTPHRNLPAALKAAGNTTTKVIGFDTAPQIVAAIKAGTDLGTADQQGYVQGFQSVIQGALALDFGFSPSNINSGGNGLLTKSNINNITAKDLKGIRY